MINKFGSALDMPSEEEVEDNNGFEDEVKSGCDVLSSLLSS